MREPRRAVFYRVSRVCWSECRGEHSKKGKLYNRFCSYKNSQIKAIKYIKLIITKSSLRVDIRAVITNVAASTIRSYYEHHLQLEQCQTFPLVPSFLRIIMEQNMSAGNFKPHGRRVSMFSLAHDFPAYSTLMGRWKALNCLAVDGTSSVRF